MLKMSFYDGTLDRKKAKEVIKNTNKKLMYRYGYGWKGAEKRSINKEQALDKVDTVDFLDISESNNEILLNGYSSNDMW